MFNSATSGEHILWNRDHNGHLQGLLTYIPGLELNSSKLDPDNIQRVVVTNFVPFGMGRSICAQTPRFWKYRASAQHD